MNGVPHAMCRCARRIFECESLPPGEEQPCQRDDILDSSRQSSGSPLAAPHRAQANRTDREHVHTRVCTQREQGARSTQRRAWTRTRVHTWSSRFQPAPRPPLLPFATEANPRTPLPPCGFPTKNTLLSQDPARETPACLRRTLHPRICSSAAPRVCGSRGDSLTRGWASHWRAALAPAAPFGSAQPPG